MYPKNLQIPFKDLPPSIINTSPSNLLLETLLLCCKKKLSSKDLAEQYTPVSFVLHTQSLHDTKQHKPATERMIFIACAVLPPQNAFLDHILIYANIFSWLLRAAWHRNTQCHSNDNCCCTTIPTESQLNFNFFYWAKPGGTNYLCFNTAVLPQASLKFQTKTFQILLATFLTLSLSDISDSIGVLYQGKATLNTNSYVGHVRKQIEYYIF